MAIGWDSAMIGYVQGGQQRWVDLGKARVTAGASSIEAVAGDPDGGTWTYRQSFKAVTGSKPGGAIEVTTAVSVDRDRAVSFLPMLVLLPGAGSFGESKGQALLPGLEYLDNEPSRSEADIRGPLANRRVPDPTHLCFPLMALQADGRWVGLIWEKRPEFSVLFDSPDRTLGSGGHAMGVFFPGTDEQNREAGSLPYGDQRRLEIARALAVDPRVLMLDEPNAGMNPSETDALLQLIRRIRTDLGLTIILIAHDIPLVMNLADRIQVLNFGSLIAEGDPATVRANPEVVAIFNRCVMYAGLERPRREYAGLPEEERASSCLHCRACETECPQTIPISEWMPVAQRVLGEGQAYDPSTCPPMRAL